MGKLDMYMLGINSNNFWFLNM